MTEQPNPQEQRVHSLLLPFAGSKGTTVIKNMNKTLKNLLPNNIKTRITYTGQKLNSRFQIRDKINEKYKHDLIYYTKCPEPSCTEDYLGETGCSIIEGITSYTFLLVFKIVESLQCIFAPDHKDYGGDYMR